MMLDYLAIFKRLNEAGVEYLVAGGMAVNFHGVPRMTYDLDLVVQLEDGNLERFVELVKKWGFQPKVPVDVGDLAIRAKREDWINNKNMRAFCLFNSEWAVSEIDVLITAPFTYEEAASRRMVFDIQGIEVPCVSVDDLISMKRGTGRQQDEADIRHLERTRREEP